MAHPYAALIRGRARDLPGLLPVVGGARVHGLPADPAVLAVRDDCRGKGYGAILVEAAVTEARRRNIRQVLVVTSNREFFERMNFGLCLNEKYALFWNGKS